LLWRQVELVDQDRVHDPPPLRRAVPVLLEPPGQADPVTAP